MSQVPPSPVGSSSLTTGGANVSSLPADPASISIVENMRLSEVQVIHRRLGRICGAERKGSALRRAWKGVEWDRFFGALAVLFLGSAVAGAIALLPLFDIENEQGERAVSARTLIEYSAALGVCFAFGILALIARMAIKGERAESVVGIYTDLGEIVGRYQATKEMMPGSIPETEESPPQ
jgi:hypothetical protein